ncbi:hypothetical protein [Cellulomonas wangsupingiae]|uniref:DUF5648 domain-containing protein n=1 Tax=Cellulomonas wangsupingiae TaxID=2968085 RepID=A0ABY5K2B2_9CELL|nr:hypothetical protein [Cellulomonas wangsupingiae]MCC2335704.1 hypothetical protein [Cellulomonas wangsupingiae]UUI63939.1 hypothetical protein NP075_12440 [Cellulomonas wangsupingiae]
MTPHHALTRSRRLTATAACALLVGAAGVVVAPAASAETVTFADAVGEPGLRPEGDIARFRVSLDADELTLTYWTVADATAVFRDPGRTSMYVDIKTDRDEDREFVVHLPQGEDYWTLFDNQLLAQTCAGPLSITSPTVSFTVPAACLRDPSQVRIATILSWSGGQDFAPGYPLQRWTSVVSAGPDTTSATAVRQSVHRFWSPTYDNAHFYTADDTEAWNVNAMDWLWRYEGVAFNALQASGSTCETGTPVHRFWSPGFRSHFYTQSAAEKNHVVANDRNWTYEGVAYCAYPEPAPGSTPLYRFWSPGFGKHFFTASQTEADHIRANDRNWVYEGVAYHVLP